MKKIISLVLAIVLVLGIALPSAAEETDYDKWWKTAPKMDKSRLDLSVFDFFKTNGTVDISYENGVLEITINNTSPDVWAKYYNSVAKPSFGGEQESVHCRIQFNGPEGTVECCVETTNPDSWIMDFEKNENKQFDEESYGGNGFSVGTIVIDEDGSAELIPELSHHAICMAWKDSKGNITYEYIELVIKISPEDTVIKIPEGKINTIKKIENIDRFEFDKSYDNFKGSFDSENAEVVYNYTGNKKTVSEIENELAGTGDGEKFIETIFKAKDGYKITKAQISGKGIKKSEKAEDERSIKIGYLLMSESSKLNASNRIEATIYSASVTNPDDKLIEKFWIMPRLNITWMENEGFKAVPENRIVYAENAVDELKEAGVHVTVDEGKIIVSYDKEIDIKKYNQIDKSFRILPLEGAASSKYTAVGGGDRNTFYDLSNGEDAEHYINNANTNIENKNLDSKILKTKTIEDITYYYSGYTQYYAFLIVWEMEDGSYEKEFFTTTYNEYVNTVATEGINSEDLGSDEIEDPTVIKDHFNKGYHGKDWRFTVKYYPQESESGNTYYFELEIKGEGSENPEELKRVYLPYNFISDDMTYEKAVEENLDVKVIHYLDESHTEYEEISGTPDENGIYFDVYTFSPFIIEWETDGTNEEEKPEIPDFPVHIRPSGNKNNAEQEEKEDEVNPGTGAPIF